MNTEQARRQELQPRSNRIPVTHRCGHRGELRSHYLDLARPQTLTDYLDFLATCPCEACVAAASAREPRRPRRIPVAALLGAATAAGGKSPSSPA